MNRHEDDHYSIMLWRTELKLFLFIFIKIRQTTLDKCEKAVIIRALKIQFLFQSCLI